MRITTLAICVLALLLTPSLTFSQKPNFIVILGDDVGWDAFGCTGMKAARTPAIDQLARESCMMTRFYCSVSQCAPLRAELYTGLLPNRNGVLANATKVKRPGVKNVADHLRPLGYRVGLTGKRHFGLGTAKIDNIPGFSPNGNGSNQTHSLDGVRDYISRAKEAGDQFCVFICSTHAHHPWDHGDETNFPVGEINLRPHYIGGDVVKPMPQGFPGNVAFLIQQAAKRCSSAGFKDIPGRLRCLHGLQPAVAARPCQITSSPRQLRFGSAAQPDPAAQGGIAGGDPFARNDLFGKFKGPDSCRLTGGSFGVVRRRRRLGAGRLEDSSPPAFPWPGPTQWHNRCADAL